MPVFQNTGSLLILEPLRQKKEKKNSLQVAMENYSASKPPLRTMNITDELTTLIQTYSVRRSIGRLLSMPS